MKHRSEPSPFAAVAPDLTGGVGGLNLALSPYHLTTRELTAAVALTIADRAVTLVPQPPDGHSREIIRQAIDRVPRLLRLLEAWRWSGPLWRMGLVAGEANDDRPFSCMTDVAAQISADPTLARIAPTKPRPTDEGDEADRWLDAFCSDLLRGGPDPGLSTVTIGALDRFAANHGFVSVRGATDSLAQRAEKQILQRVASIAIPVMSRAAGGRILELRASLHLELGALRAAISDVWTEAALNGVALDASPAAARLAEAAAAYTETFETWFSRVARDDENAERTMRAFVSLTAAVLPTDSALICARAAIRGAARAAGKAPARAKEKPRASHGTAGSGALTQAPTLRVLIIRPMNVRPV